MTRAFVDQARPIAASAEYVDLGRSGHYMLRGPANGTSSHFSRHSPCSIAQPFWNDSSPGMVDAGNVFNHFAGLHLR